MATPDIGPVVDRLNGRCAIQPRDTYTTHNTHEPQTDGSTDVDASQATGETVARINVGDPHFIISSQIGIRLIAIKPEPDQPQAGFRE